MAESGARSQLANIINNNNLSLWATATFHVPALLSSAIFLSEVYSSCPISFLAARLQSN